MFMLACRNGGYQMNKIICDICGTDYPETAAQCPICGCASAGAQTSAGNDAADGEEKAAYTPVKGGRYSKANVRKRLKENQIPYDPIPDSDPEPEYEDEDGQDDTEIEEDHGSNRGLIIVIGVLLVAIVAVAAYIAISMFGLGFDELPFFDFMNKPGTSQNASTTKPTTDPTTEPAPSVTDVACTELSISDEDIFLKSVGSTWQLTAEPVPANTTDKVVFSSTDENVVTVDASGLVTAVGTGKASVIITCGNVVVDCPVLCGEEGTQNGDPIQTPDDFELTLQSKDFTLNKIGATFDLYNGEVDPAQITWSSDNEQVATIKDGIVTAVGNGRTKVHAVYGEQKAFCWVSCKLPEEPSTEPGAVTYSIRINGHEPYYGTPQAAEATIDIGEELNIKVVDGNGKRVDAEWTASRKSIVTLEGNTVIAEKAGNVILTAEVDGQKLTCTLIVRGQA